MTTKPRTPVAATAAHQSLAADRLRSASVVFEAKRAAAVILEVLAGVRTPTAAATALKLRLPRYYLLEQRAIEGLVAACAPRPRGPTVSPDRRVAQLERELTVTRRDLLRQQALARTAQRALGLMPAPGAWTSPAGKPPGVSSATKRAPRKPVARALRAARLLVGGDSPGAATAQAVQKAVGNPAPAVPGSAGGGSRPAASESTRAESRAEQGGSCHAGRPKAAGN